jgi:hypothetical protein
MDWKVPIVNLGNEADRLGDGGRRNEVQRAFAGKQEPSKLDLE